MSTSSTAGGRLTGPRRPVSMHALLASCAAATAVSTPPEDEARQAPAPAPDAPERPGTSADPGERSGG
ncbi:hypothetical protein ACN20G_09155 [Streptomyces sp. BI20]|uniref:hypothetical protein n=1 Tax=Streptomyces sp. BI20 TaxID=3403460 RepID=UPI003C738361